MPVFPKTEPEIIRLAHDLANALAANQADFPAPPVTPEQGLALIEAYYASRDASIARVAAAHDSRVGKDKAVDSVVEWARTVINYATSLYRKDAAKLKLIGWNVRRKSERTPEAAAGQPGNLVVQHEGRNNITLTWRDPVDDGKATAYRIQRRKTGGEWSDVGTAVSSEVTLFNQESGIEFEYQVIAVNKTGDGPPSNIVRAVL